MMEPMICETFLQFRYLSDLGLSPDGRYTAYIRQQANLASNGYDARLWVYDHSTGADRPLSSLSPVRAFSWIYHHSCVSKYSFSPLRDALPASAPRS